MKRYFLVFVALGLTAQTSSDGPQFNDAGQLLMPKNYREWVFLSSGLGMTYGPAAQANSGRPMFDNVWVNPSSYRSFTESGRWPDKTMFILEIRASIEKGSINNGGHYQGGVRAVEAAVKDEKRFPEKWAYFGFGATGRATALPATSSCNACHSQNAAVEHSFVQFYPELLEVAKRKGTLNPSYVQKEAASTQAATTPLAQAAASAMVICPVCEMEIDKGDLKSDVAGATHYFCQQECKDAFDREPKRFLKK